MAMKLYENLRFNDIRGPFFIELGTGIPAISIPGTPKVWLDENVATKHPYWFKEVEVKEESKETIIIEVPEVQEEEIETLIEEFKTDEPYVVPAFIDIDSIIQNCQGKDKIELASIAEFYGCTIDKRKKETKIIETLKTDLEEMNKNE